MEARTLDTISVEKPWGVTTLPPPFAASPGGRIGEIWFDPPEGCPLLVKYLFTSERLSIQVHPNDRQARERGLAAGKEECWYILAAEPGATLGIGTQRPLDGETLRDAALSGEIENLMEWHPVEAGMFFYLPSGTIHAIGGGVSLVEIQQNMDVTYRLYDYGRPRALHLDEAVSVAVAAPMPKDLMKRVDVEASAELLDSEHLGVAHVVADDLSPLAGSTGPMMIVPLAGQVAAGDAVADAGECLWTGDHRDIRPSADARFLAGWFKR